MRSKIVWTMVVSLVLPTMVNAGENPAPVIPRADSIQLKNVELSAKGELVGQFVNKAGLPLVGRQLELQQRDVRKTVEIAEDGTFRIGNLNSGTVVFRSGKDVFGCRVWKNGTAPPKAVKSLALVSSDEIVLGQLYIPTLLPLPRLPIHFPVPRLPFAHHIGSMGLGQSLGLGVLAAGAAGIAIAVSQDDGGSNASL